MKQGMGMTKVLMVKLTSLGDVVHTLAAAHDVAQARPDVQMHWAVDEQFASILQACPAVSQVHSLPLRRLGLQFWRADWRRALRGLRAFPFDAVMDAQGLTKSALVSRLARLAPGGKRYGLAQQTHGSSYEAPTRWVSDVLVQTPLEVHALERARLLCAQALGYALPDWVSVRQRPWLQVRSHPEVLPSTVALVHGTSRPDKAWPLALWQGLGQRLAHAGFRVALLHGNDREETAAREIERRLVPYGVELQIWPRGNLTTLAERLSACCGVMGVDAGVSHIAVALGLPHVQIYNFDTAWRTGPLHEPHQVSVYGAPHPTLNAVWQAWLQCGVKASPWA